LPLGGFGRITFVVKGSISRGGCQLASRNFGRRAGLSDGLYFLKTQKGEKKNSVALMALFADFLVEGGERNEGHVFPSDPTY